MFTNQIESDADAHDVVVARPDGLHPHGCAFVGRVQDHAVAGVEAVVARHDDEVAWYGENLRVFDDVPPIEHWDQLLLRAALMRLIGLQELARSHPGWDWLREAAGLRSAVQAIAMRVDARRERT